MFSQPHFVRDYRRLVKTLTAQHGHAEAMSRAVGGNYEAIGTAQAAALRTVGLRGTDYLIDVGCGSGRTAFALRDMKALRYFGVDVVPELIEHARIKAARPDWRFATVDGLYIPAEDDAADFITFFSVLTHLTWSEGQVYLADALRALKPGGTLLFSFLDNDQPEHRSAAGSLLAQLYMRLRAHGVKNVTLTRDQISTWAERSGVSIEFHGPEHIGQSFCVVRA